ncbi:MAG: class I SAM-dependent methyltransferase [Eubacteriales bacterium]|nr:class I SAM-dependent methyltransferase [Eubacteriales bacterium]
MSGYPENSTQCSGTGDLSPGESPSGVGAKRTPRLPKPDARLRAAADWVAPCGTCADIGCDHGRLGAVLLAERRCQRLLAADISPKALAKAQARIRSLGFVEQTFFAVADGLDALDALPDKRADTLCILGMGGDTVAQILLRGRQRLQGATLILGAQTELYLARIAIQQIGYRLTDERIVQAEGRLYLLMRAMPAEADAPPYDERQLLLGPCLLKTLPAEWRPWLVRKRRLLSTAVEAMQAADRARDHERLAAALRELKYTEEALQALSVSEALKPGNGEAEP